MGVEALLALALLEAGRAEETLQDVTEPYGSGLDAMDAAQLLTLIRQAKEQLAGRVQEGNLPEAPALVITRDYRIFIGGRRGPEIRMRPMSKAVFLLFLRHPEGILLKHISDYRAEMTADYRRCMRSLNPDDVDRRIQRLMDIFSNELNVNISRVNAALAALVAPEKEQLYRVSGRAGTPKSIRFDRTLVIWE